MTGVKQSVAAFMAKHFGKSEKVISEKLSTEEHNEFAAETLKIQEQVTGLETERDTLQTTVTGLETERDTLQSQVTTLQGEKTNLETDKTTLQTNLTSMEADRDKYKAWWDKQKGSGKELPEGDATSQDGGQMTDYNADALASFRKRNS